MSLDLFRIVHYRCETVVLVAACHHLALLRVVEQFLFIEIVSLLDSISVAGTWWTIDDVLNDLQLLRQIFYLLPVLWFSLSFSFLVEWVLLRGLLAHINCLSSISWDLEVVVLRLWCFVVESEALSLLNITRWCWLTVQVLPLVLAYLSIDTSTRYILFNMQIIDILIIKPLRCYIHRWFLLSSRNRRFLKIWLWALDNCPLDRQMQRRFLLRNCLLFGDYDGGNCWKGYLV